ncbi:MAG: helix-turn-helix domain-containing protein [bacterium]|nr:helix-turn-helix domain-containing protein [bacterium]
MSKDMMNTKEVAAYLGIHEKQVYALIKANKIPCTRITGKWLFPLHLIDEWINGDAEEKMSGIQGKRTGEALLSAGSNDPVLDILLSYMKQAHPGLYIFTCNTGSTDGLMRLNEGLTDISWCHLLDPKTGEYNIPHLKEYLPGKKIAIVHLFYRELGLLYSSEFAGTIKGFEDLVSEKVKFINRQEGSGTRILLDYKLGELGINPELINGYAGEVYTHMEVGLSILSGEANAGMGTVAIANLLGLEFVPVVKESFDMVLSQETFFKKGVQAFIETLNTSEFRKKIASLGSYDFAESGKIIHS